MHRRPRRTRDTNPAVTGVFHVLPRTGRGPVKTRFTPATAANDSTHVS